MTTRDKTCEERIGAHMTSRLAAFRDLADLSGAYDDTITDEMRAAAERQDIDVSDDMTTDELRDEAQERAWELPLGVSSNIVYRVELSTGGPADWLEVVTDDGDVERIVYHFSDWFDHAERPLLGDEFDTALSFVMQIIPELS